MPLNVAVKRNTQCFFPLLEKVCRRFTVVVLLLIIIACCLLFGSDATKSGLDGCFTVGIYILFILAFIQLIIDLIV